MIWIAVGFLFALLVFYVIYLGVLKARIPEDALAEKWKKIIHHGFATILFTVIFYIYTEQFDFQNSWSGHAEQIILSGLGMIYGLITTIVFLFRKPVSFVKKDENNK